MKISDELRRLAHDEGVYGDACVGLRDLADRIDAEMAELPKDRDGVPIHVGDTVYDENGMAYEVVSISFGQWTGGVTVHAVDGFSKWRDIIPGKMAHISQDSWERIADEMDEMIDKAKTGKTFYYASDFSVFADRIRRLAERKEGK
jgi:hypothetical protein